MRSLNRLVAAFAGVFAGLLAIAVPVNFYGSLFFNRQASPANGQLDFWDGVGGSMIVLLLVVVFGFLSFILIRFALTGSKPDQGSLDE
jgi:hypothetical protein